MITWRVWKTEAVHCNTARRISLQTGCRCGFCPANFRMLRRLLIIVVILAGTSPGQVCAAGELIAPGYGTLDYVVPTAGSYALPPLGGAADALVVDSNGSERQLYQLFGERYALLSFMYSSCSDVNGCPLTAHVFYRLQRAMAQNPLLAKSLKLVSLSFDPEHDTPQNMHLYANNFRHTDAPDHWRFATTRNQQQLAPILQAYSQDVQQALATNGLPTTDFYHVLRVFLIDPQRRIRNIYSVSFLHADLILADLETLLLQERGTQVGRQPPPERPGSFGPGDRKQGYARADYRTDSLALQNREGQVTDLLRYASNPPLGLPAVPRPHELVLSPASIALGRKLFFDRRLSLNKTFSCAMCHVPEQGFANNEMATAVGIEGRSVRRNAPSLLNVAYASRLFHDGREDRLSQQVWAPLLAANEMGNPSIGYVINTIRSLADYDGLFAAVYDAQQPGMQNIGDALAAYQMTLNAADSPFDRWYFGGDAQAVGAAVKHGFELFRGKAGCASCHTVTKDYALFSDYAMHNTGVGYLSSQVNSAATVQVQLAPGVFVDVQREVLERVGEPLAADLGLYEITENPADRWKFKTPTLRNVALSAPYMHDGSLTSLREVVEFYNRGGIANPLLDPLLRPLQLQEQEVDALVALLQALNGSNLPVLLRDAFAAPVGDTGGASPAKGGQRGQGS